MADITDAGCGDVKGCYRVPDSCVQPGSCDYFASWTPRQGGVLFELSVTAADPSRSWAALGLSKDRNMVRRLEN